jgi:NitT/TauT family transport system substrate-binding protein
VRAPADRRVRLAAVVALAALVLAAVAPGCGGGRDGPRLAIGYFPNVTHAAPILGLSEGIYARHLPGVRVEGRRFLTGPEAVSALLSDSVDAVYTGPGPVLTAASRAPGELLILAGAAEAGALLVARPGAGIRRVRDLAGRRVAVPTFGGTQDLTLRDLLRSAGLRSADRGGSVRLMPVDNAELRSALRSGVVDAAMAPEPWASTLIAAGAADLVLDADEILGGRYPTTVLAVRTHLARERPDVVRRLLEANAEAVRLVRAKPGLAARRYNEIVTAAAGRALSAEVLRRALRRTRASVAVRPQAMARLLAAARDAGYLAHDVRLADLVR